MGERRAALWTLFAALLGLNAAGIRPNCNWDILGYVGSAYVYLGRSPQETHAPTYAAALAFCGGRGNLRPDSPYQATMAADAVAFAQQLPFYTVKPAYPALIALLARAGVSPARASLIVSIAAYLGIGVVVLLWLERFLPLPNAVVCAWALTALPFVLELGKLSTPDALSTLVVLLALYALFVPGAPRTALALLVGSMLVRPDDVFWLAAVGGHLAIRAGGRPIPRSTLAAAAAAGVVYALETSLSHTYGWRVQFHHQFVARLAYPADFHATLGLRDYAWIYLRETHPANLPAYLLLVALIGIGTWALRRRLDAPSDPWRSLLGVTAAFMTAHWLFYPEEDRLFAAAYLVVLIAAVVTLHEVVAPQSRARRPDSRPGYATAASPPRGP